MKLSQKVLSISPSPTLSVDSKAKQMRKEGKDVIGFGAGEPDFDTPEYIKVAGISAIKQGFTKYTPVSGMPELKEAVSQYIYSSTGIEYSPNQIIISNGAKHSLFNIFFSLLNPGDEVLIPMPYWATYPELVKLCGGKPVFVPTNEEENFVLKAENLKAYLSEKTKALILNSPNNPTGSLYTKKDLENIAHFAIENDIIVISDEIYGKLVYDGEEHVSIASLGKDISKKTIIVDGVSKTFAMTGWRIGFVAGPEDFIKAMDSFQSQTTSNPNSIAQKASIEALTNPVKKDEISKMVQEFSKRRNYMVEKINQISGLSCIKPKGAFYLLMNISKTFGKYHEGELIDNSTSFSEILLDKFEVAVVPGIAFGADTHVRLSYATSMENIKKGLERIEKFIKTLK